MDNGYVPERRQSDELFRLVVEAAPSAMLLVARDGTVTLVNRQAEQLFGYSRGELLGQPLQLLIPERFRRQHPGHRAGFFDAPRARRMGAGRVLYGRTRDGTEVPVEIGLNPLETADGTFVLAVIVDITDRRQAEAALRAANQSLEVQVGETRRALEDLKTTQGQLVQAEKLASLGGLVAGVAHEINTPVGIGVTAASHLKEEVKGLRQAIKANTLTKARFEAALDGFEQSSDIILLNLRRAADLIRSFKQVAADQASDQHRRVNLREYIEEVLLSLRPKLKGTPHAVTVECPPRIEIDTIPGALSQILTNLFVNALVHAFRPDRPGHIRIAALQVEDTTEITFSDDGVGIPEADLPRVFDPFFTTRRSQGGTGLGLHIVYNLVRQTLHGNLTVSSQPGHGTTFTLTF